ncbi:MAG: S49 family peptidase, partial [Salinivenus sp.]
SDRIAAVALDLTDLSVSREKAWELRQAVQDVQAAGKEVVAFLESAGIDTYHAASAADRVVIDPQGTLQLPGYASSRTFVKGTLDKIGLGVQPFRFFEYKSAVETLTRTGFSEADSLQRQQLVDDWYALARTGVADGRGLAPDTVDHLIDEQTVLSASNAREAGLVDSLARWHERDALLSEAAGTETSAMDLDRLNAVATATRAWGARPEIAVVYGIGATSLDSGIQARELAKTFRQLTDDDDVEAVVFRVDSPGGSALAADRVAQAVRACAEEKPVVVSQGTVAASGGYLISTYADRIFAGPNTVTGSIGVIGLWVYDDGLLSEKAEASYDVVQQGARADLFAPYRVPLLGLPLPARKLDEDELARARDLIRQSYDDFVGQVAAGRDTSESYVRSVGEGRVYSGTAGQQRALVDEIGGLSDALAAARQAAGVPDDRVAIREVNATSGFLTLPGILPSGLRQMLGTEDDSNEASADPAHTFLRTVVEHQPDPLLLLPPGYYADPESVR